MITFGDLYEYVVANRRGKAFDGWSVSEIMSSLMRGAKDRSLLYCTDGRGKIIGMAVGLRSEESSVIHVDAVITTARGALGALIRRYYELYPDYELHALRHGHTKNYDTQRLNQKFSLKEGN